MLIVGINGSSFPDTAMDQLWQIRPVMSENLGGSAACYNPETVLLGLSPDSVANYRAKAQASPVDILQAATTADESASGSEESSEDKVVETYCQFIQEDNSDLSHDSARMLACRYQEEEKKYGFKQGLLLAIGHVESGHKPEAVSSEGAKGIMQIMPATGEEFAEKMGIWQKPCPRKTPPDIRRAAKKELEKIVSNPGTNIQLAANILDSYWTESGKNLDKALQRYSGGDREYPNRVRLVQGCVLAELRRM